MDLRLLITFFVMSVSIFRDGGTFANIFYISGIIISATLCCLITDGIVA
jgi:hypothetical protein